MSAQARVEAELKAAMKAREAEKVSTLRLLLAEVKNERIRLGQDLDEPAFAAVVQKGIKRRQEAAEQYRKGAREEAAAKEEREAAILQAYLPEQVSEDEIRAAVTEVIRAQGLNGPAALGQVMKAMMARFRGRADGAVVNRIARETLARET